LQQPRLALNLTAACRFPAGVAAAADGAASCCASAFCLIRRNAAALVAGRRVVALEALPILRLVALLDEALDGEAAGTSAVRAALSGGALAGLVQVGMWTPPNASLRDASSSAELWLPPTTMGTSSSSWRAWMAQVISPRNGRRADPWREGDRGCSVGERAGGRPEVVPVHSSGGCGFHTSRTPPSGSRCIETPFNLWLRNRELRTLPPSIFTSLIHRAYCEENAS
jgi:hypothetical protein